MAELTTPSGVFSLRSSELAPSLKPTPQATERSATFGAKQATGRGVVIHALASGLEQDVVLADATASGAYVTEIVMPKGVTARAGAFGVEFVGEDGGCEDQLVVGAWCANRGDIDTGGCRSERGVGAGERG